MGRSAGRRRSAHRQQIRPMTRKPPPLPRSSWRSCSEGDSATPTPRCAAHRRVKLAPSFVRTLLFLSHPRVTSGPTAAHDTAARRRGHRHMNDGYRGLAAIAQLRFYHANKRRRLKRRLDDARHTSRRRRWRMCRAAEGQTTFHLHGLHSPASSTPQTTPEPAT